MPKNLIMNGVSFLVNVIAGLWLVPYLVKEIGTIAYGFIPLAMVFTEYINLITVSINGAISRFLTIDIQNNDWDEAKKTFNTAFFALLSLVIIQIPILGFITFFVDSILNVPAKLLGDIYYLFGFTFLGYLISLFSSIFNTPTLSYNRLDLARMVDISKITTRIITIIFCFSFFQPSLKFVGLANLMGALATFIISFRYWKILTPKLNVNITFYDPKRLRKILGMGGWLIINMVGYLLFLKIDLILINKFIGVKQGGEYAAILQWNSLIRTVAGVLSGVVTPMILISYANNKINDVIRFAKLGVKFLTIFIGVLTGIISGIAVPLLNLWLGESFIFLAPLLILMLSHLVINLGILPLLSINVALNKLKFPGIMSLLMGFVNLVLALIFILFFNWGFYGVALAGGLALTFKNGLFTPIYAAHVLKLKKTIFFKPLISGLILFFLSFGITYIISYNISIDNWLKIAGVFIFVGIIMLFLVWSFILTNEEKIVFKGYLPFKKV